MKAQRTLREELDRLVMLLQRSLGFWKRSLIVFLVTMVVAVPVVFTRPRSYRSETVILYQETIRSSDLTGGESGQSDSRRVGARLREMLLSRASLEPIVKDLNLYDALNEKRSLVDAVDDMRKHITFRAREGDTFEISFIGDTPQQTQEVTRRLADCIVQEAVARRAEQAKVVKDFLDAESERNKTELKAKEAALAKFFALHPEFAPPPGTPLGTMPTARPAGAAPTRPAEDPAILALEARAARIERQLKGPGEAPPTPQPTAAPTAAPAPLPDSPELVAARQDLADKLTRYTDKHPDVIAARNRVRLAEAAQAAARAAQPPPAPAPPTPAPEEQRTLSAEERDALKKQLAQIVNEIAIRRAVLKSAGGAEPATASTDTPVALEVEYRRLLHEVTETRDRQRQLDDRQFKAAITASSVMSDRNIQVSVLDPAFLPSRPISQPRSRLLIVGFVIGIFLALLTAFVSARLDDRIYDRVDLEVLDILPVVGVIPRLTAGDRKD